MSDAPIAAEPSGGRKAGRRAVRQNLSSAAITLFLAKGYDGTTADEIAEAAGVARRTFFRYFRVKEEAVFPDHEEYLARVEEYLSRADPAQPAFAVLGGAAQLALALHTEDAATAVRRYQLIREVESLREREITTTNRYQRSFVVYLHQRLGGGAGERLLHEVAASAVVAAHNFVLRQWLREGGQGDARVRLERALQSIGEGFPRWLHANGANAAHGADEADVRDDEVVVLRVRPNTPLWRIVQEIDAAAKP